MGGNIARYLKDQDYTVTALFDINRIDVRDRRDCLTYTYGRHI